MEAAMTKLRQALSAFSERMTCVVRGEVNLELDVSDQEIAEALYRRNERSDTGEPE
jgi:hypothetical protein